MSKPQLNQTTNKYIPALGKASKSAFGLWSPKGELGYLGEAFKKKTTKLWTLSKPLTTPPPLVWTLKVWTVRKGSDHPPLPPKVWTLGFKKFEKRQMTLAKDKVPIGVGYEPVEV